LGSEGAEPRLVSIVVTVRNAGPQFRGLLESLIGQESPFEVIIVDALSRDDTFETASEFAQRFPGQFRVVQHFGSRGIGRNLGVSLARGDLVAFIDGDCVADSQWLKEIRAGFRASEVVAGRTEAVGRGKFGVLDRVELILQGGDVTYPSCNLGYRRKLFERLKGFDPRFITAEDIDLNLRAVQSGIQIHAQPFAIVYHQMRDTLLGFLYQAFWNGYGRKQLTEKHGNLWGSYRPRRLLTTQRTLLGFLRLAAAFTGYLTRVLTGRGRRLTPALPFSADFRDSAAAAERRVARNVEPSNARGKA
jgi:glycosyltransferase involved in cell wall biosynthesis